jgi:hypothetical protein
MLRVLGFLRSGFLRTGYLRSANINTFQKMPQSNTLAYFAVMPVSDLTFLIIDNLSVTLST